MSERKKNIHKEHRRSKSCFWASKTRTVQLRNIYGIPNTVFPQLRSNDLRKFTFFPVSHRQKVHLEKLKLTRRQISQQSLKCGRDITEQRMVDATKVFGRSNSGEC